MTEEMANAAAGGFERLLERLTGDDLREYGELSDPQFLREAIWLARYLPAGDLVGLGEKRAEADQPKEKTADESTKGQPRDPLPPDPAPPAGPERDDRRSLFAKSPAGTGGGRAASAVHVPASGALPNPLELSRALRPFQRRLPSRRFGDLDETATAELSAECRAVVAVFRPRAERWFSVTLLLDTAPAMTPWRRTAQELAQLLGGLGLFRDVRQASFGPDLRLERGGAAISASQLADPTGRTLLVILTNGVGRHWQSRELARWMGEWGRSTAVVVCSLLPETRWQYTHLGAAYLWARSPVPGAANGRLIAGEGRRSLRLEAGSTLYPVFPLSPAGFARWAAMQMSVRETQVAAVPLDPEWFDAGAASGVEEPAQERLQERPQERIERFWSFASPDASRLLVYLAGVPLQLAIMRMVHRAMLPDAPLSAMAEVLMSGLILPAGEGGGEPEEAKFRFADGVEEFLRSRMNVLDLAKIWGAVKEELRRFIEAKAGLTIGDFEAWLLDPGGVLRLEGEAGDFARVAFDSLVAMGYQPAAVGAVSAEPAEQREKNKSVTISTVAAGVGLREDLTRAAQNNGLSVEQMVAAIYEYAVDHRDQFQQPLQNSRPKGGQQIHASVSGDLREALNEWAYELGTPRSVLCCFLLEKTLESQLVGAVLGEPQPPSIPRPPRPPAVPVYVSHSRLDSGWVDRVEKALGPLGEEGLIRLGRRESLGRGAKAEKEELWLAGLKTARVVVVLVSKHYNESDYCQQREAPVIGEFAKDSARRVIRVQWDAQKDRMDKRLARLAEEVRAGAHAVSAGTEWVNPVDGLTYIWCPPGRFMMGASPEDKEAYDRETPAREVVIEKGFWIGQTPVTQAAWEKVMGKNPSRFKGQDRPVEKVSWHDAVAYAEKVGMRLPSEAEWEYAARAGSGEARYGELDEIAWSGGNSGGETHAVKQKKANAWGLYDMLGNVWEWTGDWHDSSRSRRTLRGGSWSYVDRYTRVSVRPGLDPVHRNVGIGFRCIGEPPSL